MILGLDEDAAQIISHVHSRIPKTGWFGNKSIFFTLMDRKVKYMGRKVRVSPNGGEHILCVDVVGNVEIYDFDAVSGVLEINTRINNTFSMSDPWDLQYSIHDCEWFDHQTLLICFSDYSWILVHLLLLSHQQHLSDRKALFQYHLLGPQREVFISVPVLSRSFSVHPSFLRSANADHNKHHHHHHHHHGGSDLDNELEIKSNNNKYNDTTYSFDTPLRQLFVLELFENYTRREDDQFLSFHSNPQNAIEKQRFEEKKKKGGGEEKNQNILISLAKKKKNIENKIYGWRKRHYWHLSSIVTLKPVELFQRYLKNHEFEQALNLARHCRLNEDIVRKKQLNALLQAFQKGASIDTLAIGLEQEMDEKQDQNQNQNQNQNENENETIDQSKANNDNNKKRLCER
ncbi:hypothetical protein RFI_20461 [Reticulomyxa filosa]|uniref:Uncharacterized protein n=1 Tax=Reticulomyxa filosa TaxID=46433 RepID=X6MSF8_RETFI|nr:hypothetical protein RFI_20461 [Reticulomyxa filosa]|eukprot:ETO16878.1 hypothetical protein RFI_20461 [Reticulomyxa filosa]